ncbi:hypothetical protein Tco_1312682 [Tanacetum coccineum]
MDVTPPDAKSEGSLFGGVKDCGYQSQGLGIFRLYLTFSSNSSEDQRGALMLDEVYLCSVTYPDHYS